MVAQLVRSISRVDASEDGTTANDSQVQDGILDLQHVSHGSSNEKRGFTSLKQLTHTQSPGLIPWACRPATSWRTLEDIWRKESEFDGERASIKIWACQ